MPGIVVFSFPNGSNARFSFVFERSSYSGSQGSVEGCWAKSVILRKALSPKDALEGQLLCAPDLWPMGLQGKGPITSATNVKEWTNRQSYNT